MYWRGVLASLPGSNVELGPPSLRRLRTMSFSGNERDPLFVNDGHGHFVDEGYAAGVDLPGDGRSGVFADLDGDGDLDLVARQVNAPRVVLLRNDTPRTNHSLQVRAVGTKTNRMGLGVTVQACVADHCQVREIHLGHGYLASGPAVAHFGLGAATAADLVITWPRTGQQARLEQVPVDGIVTVIEGKPGFVRTPLAPVALGPPPPPALTARALLPRWEPGQPVLVNLWAPWCKPCREEAPVLGAFKAAHPDARALALAMEPDLEKDRAAAKELGLAWEIAAADASAQAVLADALDGLDLPTTLAFDARGAWVGGVAGRASPAALETLWRRAQQGPREPSPDGGPPGSP